MVILLRFGELAYVVYIKWFLWIDLRSIKMEGAMLPASLSILGLVPLAAKYIWYDVSLTSSPRPSGIHVPEKMHIRPRVSTLHLHHCLSWVVLY